MTNQTEIDEADRALKAQAPRHVGRSATTPLVASELIPELGPVLVDGLRDPAGDRVLDVARGSGNAADPGRADRRRRGGQRPDARSCSTSGRAAAAERGVELEWQEADAEALPFADSAFDAVMSCVGVMFAPHHQRAPTSWCGCAGRAGRSGC